MPPRCFVCEKTFVQVAELLNLLKEETLSPEAQVKVAVVASSLRNTGNYLIDMAIAENSHGRDHYIKEG